MSSFKNRLRLGAAAAGVVVLGLTVAPASAWATPDGKSSQHAASGSAASGGKSGQNGNGKDSPDHPNADGDHGQATGHAKRSETRDRIGRGNGSDHTGDNPANQEPQPGSNGDFTGHGANTHGAYDSTRDGSPSGNGNGNGEAVGKPCAGCVGKADNKNPPGQRPDGSDRNAGYECDRNHGIGRTNPAHTGCRTTPTTTPPPTCPSGHEMVGGRCKPPATCPGGEGMGGAPCKPPTKGCPAGTGMADRACDDRDETPPSNTCPRSDHATDERCGAVRGVSHRSPGDPVAKRISLPAAAGTVAAQVLGARLPMTGIDVLDAVAAAGLLIVAGVMLQRRARASAASSEPRRD